MSVNENHTDFVTKSEILKILETHRVKSTCFGTAVNIKIITLQPIFFK